MDVFMKNLTNILAYFAYFVFKFIILLDNFAGHFDLWTSFVYCVKLFDSYLEYANHY